MADSEAQRLEESRIAREKSNLTLRGGSAVGRRHAANAYVKAKRILGEEPEPWIVDVAEGRLPA